MQMETWMSGPDPGAPGTPESVDVLLGDDEPLFMGTLCDLLVDQGYAVTTASDGMSAVHLTRCYRPAIVFLDLAMPGIGGEDACRLILSEPDPPRVVILTAHATEDQVRRLLNNGATAVLLKPIPSGQILRLLGEACRARAIATSTA
jgi:CheY-like chemotaxis protein